MVNCEQCGKSYGLRKHLLRHIRSVHEQVVYTCPHCLKAFERLDVMTRHEKTCQGSRKRPLQQEDGPPSKTCKVGQDGGSSDFKCEKCGTSFNQRSSLLRHKRNVHSGGTSDLNCSKVESALEQTVSEVELSVYDKHLNLDVSLENLRQDMKDNINNRVGKGVKWQLIVKVKFIRPNTWCRDDVLEIETYFRSKTYTVLQSTDCDEQISLAIGRILEVSQEFVKEGSGWKFDSLLGVKMCIAVYEPLAASSFIPLPRELQLTKSIMNVQNNDQKCFLWSVLAALHPAEKDPQRVGKYLEFEKELDVTGLDFPLPLTQVKRFAERNQMTVNVYGYEKKLGVYPLLIDGNSFSKHVDLLLIANDHQQHYCLIKSMSRLLSNLTKHKASAYYCKYCLHRFSRKDLLDKHNEMCRDHEAQKIELPKEEDSVMKFRNIRKQLKAPFIIYGDFESYAVKIEGPKPSSEISSTTATTRHVPSGFCFVVVGPDGKFYQDPVIYHGEDVVEVFFDKIIEVQGEITAILANKKPLVMSRENEEAFRTATQCHICLTSFTLNEVRVRDHDHLTGKYRGAAHQLCNLEYQVCDSIPVVFHNLKNYDSHLLMQGIGKVKNQKITCIANNMEKYITFSLGNLKFIDSLQFLSASLDSLVSNLAKNGVDAFQCVKQYFPVDKMSLLLRKGVFPYDFLESPDCFNVTDLPAPEAFYNQLTETMISEEDYQHAKHVWSEFEMKNFGEYHDLYMTLDVLLLADVFENFRRVCLQYYRLDPIQYFTLPGLAWDACLLKTGVELELFTDPDKYLFCERGIRGGISMISNRHSKANNPYLEGYDSTKPTTYITYIDMNNLYGCSMIDFLPTGNFRWVDYPSLNVMDVADDSETGYILEVDLEYPEHLHDTHSDYPLAPERMKIDQGLLSPYSKELLEFLGMEHTGKVDKLVPNLFPKKNYVLHYRNLKLYLSLGLKLVKIHRVLQFEQRPWLRPYIDFNTTKRKDAKTDFEKDFFKLMNNAVFGKSMESPRKHINVHLVQTPKQLKKLVAKPSYQSSRIFSEDLVGVELKKTILKLNKPIYTGLAILDLSKLFMYDYHYNHMLPKYGSRVQLNFTDTDSFCYTIQTEDLYMDMLEDLHLYDTSDYPIGHFLHSSVNKKVLGKFKDEVSGGFVEEFVGLRPKCYSLKTSRGEKKTAKGVGKTTTKRDLQHEKYKTCLIDRTVFLASMNRIQSTNHQLYTTTNRKIGLSPGDDKRYILQDGTSTLAHGHYRIDGL